MRRGTLARWSAGSEDVVRSGLLALAGGPRMDKRQSSTLSCQLYSVDVKSRNTIRTVPPFDMKFIYVFPLFINIRCF
jgi:hypothetical protein